MEWRKCTTCLKLQVSFCKRAATNRALLQKMTYKDEASYACLPPCNRLHQHILAAAANPWGHSTMMWFRGMQPDRNVMLSNRTAHSWGCMTLGMSFKWVMSHMRKSHVTHAKESCHSFNIHEVAWHLECHSNESCHICERVMSLIQHSWGCMTRRM